MLICVDVSMIDLIIFVVWKPWGGAHPAAKVSVTKDMQRPLGGFCLGKDGSFCLGKYQSILILRNTPTTSYIISDLPLDTTSPSISRNSSHIRCLGAIFETAPVQRSCCFRFRFGILQRRTQNLLSSIFQLLGMVTLLKD